MSRANSWSLRVTTPCIVGVQLDTHVAERIHQGGMMGMRLDKKATLVMKVKAS